LQETRGDEKKGGRRKKRFKLAPMPDSFSLSQAAKKKRGGSGKL